MRALPCEARAFPGRAPHRAPTVPAPHPPRARTPPQAPYANTVAVIKALTAKATLLDYSDTATALTDVLSNRQLDDWLQKAMNPTQLSDAEMGLPEEQLALEATNVTTTEPATESAPPQS